MIFPKEKKSGIGVVIRDSRGLVIASCSKVVHQVLGVFDVEAMVATWALSFASDVGVKRVVLEGDSMVVIVGGWDGIGAIQITIGGCKVFVPTI